MYVPNSTPKLYHEHFYAYSVSLKTFQTKISGKVTAQRKFAQGAFMPPHAITVGTNAPERREMPSTSRDTGTQHYSNISTESLLDHLCFRNNHAHIQPIVLVERLPEKKPLVPNNSINLGSKPYPTLIERQQKSPKSRKVTNREARHAMQLRSSDRLTNSITTTATKSKINKRTTNVSHCIKPKAHNQRKLKRKLRQKSTYQFSVDDNRPLKYLASARDSIKSNSKSVPGPLSAEISPDTSTTTKQKKKALKRPICDREDDERTPPSGVPCDVTSALHAEYSEQITAPGDACDIPSALDAELPKPITTPGDACDIPSALDAELPKPITAPGGVCDIPSALHAELPEPITTPGDACDTPSDFDAKLPKLLISVHAESITTPGGVCDIPSALHAELPEPITTPESMSVGRPSQTGAFNGTKSPSYYSEQGIHRWIDGYLPKDPELTARSSPTILDTIVINDDDSIKEDSCPSLAWRTINDVVQLSRAEYKSKCNMCINCKRIEKYEKFCYILKNKYNIDDNVHNTEELNLQPMISRNLDLTKVLIQDNVETIYMEMLPRHQHIMIKCELKMHRDKNVLSTRLIPRSRAEISTQFSFTDHEFILNNWIESVILNIEDFTTLNVTSMLTKDTIKEETGPEPGPSSYQACSQPASKCKENQSGRILNAPTFHPTFEECSSPMAYFEKIYIQASEFGICKIVLPDSFAPPCKIDDNIKFEVFNQYISRLYNRWGPSTRELCAILNSLKYNKVTNRPLIDGVEVNLPKLYHLVQHHGGLETVMNKNKWPKVAEDMNLIRGPSTGKKLDQIYVTYLLPYNALTPDERQDLFLKVERSWHKRNEKMLQRASNPLHHQKYLLGESDGSSDESDDDDDATKYVEDCVHRGQNMNLGKFKRVAKNAQYQFFKNKAVPLNHIEQEYWRMVICGTEHVCVNSASIDTGEQGIGFPTSQSDIYTEHEWNLKKLSQNKANILRSLGPVLGVTVPTLHLGMIFSSSCWHRDPHSVPWIEFQHTGPTKIWYSVPEAEGTKFCNSSKTLFPMSCQNKDLWLSSDISMIPPNLLAQQNVKVYKVEQNPGEFVLVMPRAYSCSICTGFTVSESVYFATENLLDGLVDAFKKIRKSCEPTMFALEQLLKAISEDPKSSPSLLHNVYPALNEIITNELQNRTSLINRGVKFVNLSIEPEPSTSQGKKSNNSTPSRPNTFNVRDLEECEICRCTLFLSKVKNTRKNIFLCLEHALKVMVNKKKPVRAVDLLMFLIYPSEELKNVMVNLVARIQKNS